MVAQTCAMDSIGDNSDGDDGDRDGIGDCPGSATSGQVAATPLGFPRPRSDADSCGAGKGQSMSPNVSDDSRVVIAQVCAEEEARSERCMRCGNMFMRRNNFGGDTATCRWCTQIEIGVTVDGDRVDDQKDICETMKYDDW